MRSEVSGVRLGVAADTVQRQDKRFGRVAGLDAAGPDSAGVDIVLLEGNAPQIGTDARKFAGLVSLMTVSRWLVVRPNSGVPLASMNRAASRAKRGETRQVENGADRRAQLLLGILRVGRPFLVAPGDHSIRSHKQRAGLFDPRGLAAIRSTGPALRASPSRRFARMADRGGAPRPLHVVTGETGHDGEETLSGHVQRRHPRTVRSNEPSVRDLGPGRVVG